jgi:hypothetical protein
MRAGFVDPGATYRPGLVRVASGGYALFALWWVVAHAIAGKWDETCRIAPMLFAGATLVHALFWRPEVRVDSSVVLLVNPLRRVRIPWGRVEGLDTRYALTVLAEDRRFTSWAAAAPGRPLSWRSQTKVGPGDVDRLLAGTSPYDDTSAIRSSRSLHSDSGAAAFLIESYWTAWRQSDPDVGLGRGGTERRKGAGREPDPRGDPGTTSPGEDSGPAVEWRWNVASLVAFALSSLLTIVAQML